MLKILKLTLLLGFAPVCLYAQNLETVTSTPNGNVTPYPLFLTGNSNKPAAGNGLGEVVKLQMKKIEELTLYILEQNKRIEALEAQQQKK
ncbi:hypothetical protein CLV59_11431 [Chitinophaga dinghuensis]|uniref:Uncharacterized protein n=1 Tax=Chitinophaga dinghuensis TaxID=1539050 RepID=A0A327VGX3_9BACT|nr:hypothetical protein [Chitinophaga dinghuensis]RAJ72828.1 hypothetical protein CLV59_11431 [Chitinophaga dinghuensis]